MKTHIAALALSLALATGAAQAAQEIAPRIQSTSISFSGGQTYSNAVLTVSGPHGYSHEESAARGLPIFRLQTAGRLVDGYYQFALIAASDEEVRIESQLDNGRGEAARKTQLVPFSMYGAFRVEKGLIQPVESGDGGADSDG